MSVHTCEMSQRLLPPEAQPADGPAEAPVARPELEEALRFLNHNAVESRLAQADIAATVTALVETLLARGLLPPGELEWRRQRALDAQKVALYERPVVRFGEAVDKYALGPLPEIDCASLIP